MKRENERESERHMVAGGLQTFLPRGVELTARLSALNNTGTQHVKIAIKGIETIESGSSEKVKAAAAESDGDEHRYV